ncbi:hypothetical protein MTO96_051529 [Rhipicephalus appendiculatus]
MMSSNDPEFRKHQLQMTDRYPRYGVRAEASWSSSSRMLYKTDTTGDVEQAFEGGAPDDSQLTRTASSSQLVASQPESSDYQVSRKPSTAELSYAKTKKEQFRARLRRLLEKQDRLSWELRRDCVLIALVLLLLVLLILWLACGGFFTGANKEDNTPTPTLDISAFPGPTSVNEDANMIRRDHQVVTRTTKKKSSKGSPTPVTEAPTPRPILPKGGPLRIIMDVDTGVDDAMALIFALTSERATVEAITVLLGRTDMLVYKGADRPIAQQLETEEFFFGPDSFGGVSNKYPMAALKSVSNKVAHVVMRDMIRQRPKELTLLMVGPLTNLAIAMLMDPGLTDDVAQIFILGGNIYGKGNVKPGGEFNFVTDPEAARVVLQRATCPVTVVVWEAVIEATVPWDVYNEVVAKDTKLAMFLREVNNHTIECCMKRDKQSGFGVGDFLAVMAALVPESVSGSMDILSDVELNGEYTRGQMVHAWHKGQLPHITHSVRVVYNFDIEALSNQFRKVFMAEVSDDE